LCIDDNEDKNIEYLEPLEVIDTKKIRGFFEDKIKKYRTSF